MAENFKSPLSFQNWRERIRSLGLGELWDELLRPGSPLAFIAAQGLRAAHPVLGVFTDADALAKLTALADQLEGDQEGNA
ncbi:MAG: hypothetical protein AAB427_10530 [Chloroflexota bacterium]